MERRLLPPGKHAIPNADTIDFAHSIVQNIIQELLNSDDQWVAKLIPGGAEAAAKLPVSAPAPTLEQAIEMAGLESLDNKLFPEIRQLKVYQ